MKLSKNIPIYAFGCALMVSACGEDGPNLDQLREDFDNPSGSTTNRDAVIAVSTKQQGLGPFDELTTTVPGLGLTASDWRTGSPQRSPLTRLNPRMTWERRAEWLHDVFTRGQQRSALSTAQFGGDDDCDEAAERAFQELLSDVDPGDESFSGSTSYSVNLASCSDDLTGNISVEVELEASRNSFEMRVSQDLNNVCEVASTQQACVNGSLVMEVTAESLSNTSASLSYLVGWEISGTWIEDGQPRTVSLKGGVRSSIAGSENSGRLDVEFLFYVTDPDGEEYAYVLAVVAESNAGQGSVSWRLRGNDGEIECAIESSGAGTCTGPNGQISWTEEEADELDPAWLG